MIQIPKLPTNNLYTFVALAGLVISLCMVILLAEASYRIVETVYQREIDTALLRADTMSLTSDMKSVKPQERLLETFLDRSDLLNRRLAELHAKNSQGKLLVEQILVIWLLCILVVSFSVYWMCWGFSRWYSIQKLQDALLIARLKRMQKDLEEP
ncbi:MAG TPA: hypothetical protein VFY39_06550 [Gammaproteobacteria bacterium]|nr:hypothetical protein [Gammaproteobacteria bacterium]